MADVTVPGSRTLWGDGGLSGVMLLWGVAGAILVLSGIKNASIADTARAIFRGQEIPSGPPTVARTGPAGSAAGTATGRAVALRAMSYQGVPYVWGGETPDGWDCSGFVTWVLHRDFGISLPNNEHTVTTQFLTWSGARTIPRSQAAPGDLACWVSHIGIVVAEGQMVHAPGIGQRTKVGPIGPGVTFRRPLAYGAE